MKIYRLSKLNKLSSLTLYISEHKQTGLNTIYEVSCALTTLLFNSMDKFDKNYHTEFRKVPEYDTITIDGFKTDASSGVLNFYIEGINPASLDKYIGIILEYLKSKRIKVGQLKKNQSQMWDVPVVRIPIEISKDQMEMRPPEINMSNNNAFFIFNNVLKVNKNLWEEGNFSAKDLKRRIEYFEGETRLPEGEYAGQPYIKMDFNEAFGDPSALSGEKAMSNYDEEKVRAVLGRMKEFCDWAITNGYDDIYLA